MLKLQSISSEIWLNQSLVERPKSISLSDAQHKLVRSVIVTKPMDINSPSDKAAVHQQFAVALEREFLNGFKCPLPENLFLW